MKEIDPNGLLAHFSDLPDPRDPRGVRHRLADIVCISILAVICGANSYSQIRQYGLAQQQWLSSFLELPSGIPSQDTFERLFSLLKPELWQARFLAWMKTLALPELPAGAVEVLAVDGKTARGSQHHDQAALHMVSVYSSQLKLVLTQQQVLKKSNEITVIPGVLEVINPAGTIVTTDALGAQKQVAWSAREHQAHYLLALKENHPKLYADVQWLFTYHDEQGWQRTEADEEPYSYTRTVERGHGRREVRECWVLPAPELLHERDAWRDLRSVVRVRCQRELNGQVSEQLRYFITSLPCDAERALSAARLHWGIENGLHWLLDTAFDEDLSRVRLQNAQANWVALRHLAINLLKRDDSVKAGVEAKRLRAGWDRAYLLKLLAS